MPVMGSRERCLIHLRERGGEGEGHVGGEGSVDAAAAYASLPPARTHISFSKTIVLIIVVVPHNLFLKYPLISGFVVQLSNPVEMIPGISTTGCSALYPCSANILPTRKSLVESHSFGPEKRLSPSSRNSFGIRREKSSCERSTPSE